MFGIEYKTWKAICNMYFNLGVGLQKAYLQWFPFSKLSKEEKETICSEDFFKKYIDSGAFVLLSNVMYRTDNYIQKADGSFRDSSLVSPILFLILQAIGKEISQKYISKRQSGIEVYYAGNYENMRAQYKKDYDNFYKAINASIENYTYFIKTDITNFFSNINIDKLMNMIDRNCNSEEGRVTQTQLQLYKELLEYIGNGKFPLVENSMALSYFATIIYLDEIDQKIYRYILDNIPEINSFEIFRYVDDMYILFSSDKEGRELNTIYKEIRNEYSSILKENGLALNTKKCCLKKTHNVCEELKKSLYDEYVNGINNEISELFKGKVYDFLDDIYLKILFDDIGIEEYNELIKNNFYNSEIEFTPSEVLNHFVYENVEELQRKDVKELIREIINTDISFIALDPKRLTVMIIKTGDSKVIRALLNQLFKRSREKKWNSYDTTIAISYLIQSEFKHIDLLNVLKKQCNKLYSYYLYNCKDSFLLLKYNPYIEIINSDWKAYYLYFMYCVEVYKCSYMTAYAYFKNYFDRVTADIAFKIQKDKSDKRPNYNLYYRENVIKKFYEDILRGEEIIEKAHKLRNANPVSHASAELINKNDTSDRLKESIKDLKWLLEEKCKDYVI